MLSDYLLKKATDITAPPTGSNKGYTYRITNDPSIGNKIFPKHTEGLIVTGGTSDGVIIGVTSLGHIRTAFRNNGTWQNGREFNGRYEAISGMTGSSYVKNFEAACWRCGRCVSGHLIFTINSTMSLTDTAASYGWPKSVMNQQLIGSCVAGTNTGKSTRFRIQASNGAIVTYYSGNVLAVGDTWCIPVNYITKDE